ncbi:MAG: c-type cytochrome biogenesis protein CcsB [Neisseriaceae bacterium]|nr:c-type cytochrome biogenesis protein CcsB [Neisseriaceae bacterium]
MKNNNLQHELLQKKGFFKNLTLADWIFALIIIALAVFARIKLVHSTPNIYEEIIFGVTALSAIFLGWFFKSLRWFIPVTAILAYLAVLSYGGNIDNSQRFWLKYMLSSQSAIMWQCVLIVLAFFVYLLGSIVAAKQKQDQNTLITIGSGIAWAGALAGFVGLLVRWHESYLISVEAGHIPVSNLYEVLVLFMAVTALMFLYYANKTRLHRLGVFVYAFQAALVAFFLWYINSRANVGDIQPLIPALQSWWMKIHVPANFVGYGGFCLAAMLAVAELKALFNEETGKENSFLPSSSTIEDIMYKAIAVGFLFFTIATILGALWAAEAWGSYWSWDPKETWALIVWLNYAVWLHLRLVAGWRGKVLAWWAILGLLITTFAFVGVNMFLTGLHSYGGL